MAKPQAEVWRAIPILPGWQASNHGQIRNRATRSIQHQTTLSKIDPYLRVRVEGKKILVHRLVLAAFKGVKNLPCNHKDGVKHSNHITNLEYVTHSQNVQHAYDTGLNDAVRRAASKAWKKLHKDGRIRYSRGDNHKNSKLRSSDVKRIRIMFAAGLSNPQIASKYRVARATICQIRNGKTWKHA